MRAISRIIATVSILCTGLISSVIAQQVITYPNLPGRSTSDDYTVTVNGTGIWVEESGPGDPNNLSVASFVGTGQLAVKVTAKVNISSYKIRPKSKQVIGSVSGPDLSFTVTGPVKLYIEVNGLSHLAIFADAPEVNPPQQGAANVTYYAPGSYSGGITLQSNQTYYIAPGAVINGGISGSNVQNAKVIGRGMVAGTSRVSNSSNITYDGFRIVSTGGWTVTWNSVNHSAIRNVKIFSYCSPYGCDGMDINHCQFVTIDNCFTRAMDDCIAIKSFPAGNQRTDSITVINCISVGWQTSDGTTLGFELETDSVNNVLVKNCDFLYARGGGTSGGHSGFSITCDGPAWVTGIRFEDIRCEEHVETRNLELTITEGTQWGSSPAGAIGHIKGVYIKNCSWLNTNSPLKITGYSANNLVEDVTFDHCSVAGKILTGTSDARFETNAYTRNIRFVNDPGVFTSIAISPSVTAVKPGQTRQFTARAVDQYGMDMPSQPASFAWSVSGGGAISASGLFTAGTSTGGPYTVTASGALAGVTKSGTASITVSNQLPGLDYSYYQGTWSMLPNFASLTPVKTGIVPNFDISVATAADSFGIQFSGYINIPAAGQYTFTTRSDDGSKLYIDNQQIVNNDGAHAPQDATGTVTLTAGMHAIKVTFFEASQGQELTVSWQGPGFAKQTIPDGALFLESGAAASRTGWQHVPSSIANAQAVKGGLHIAICAPGKHSISIMRLSGGIAGTIAGQGPKTYDFRGAGWSTGAYIVTMQAAGMKISRLVVVR